MSISNEDIRRNTVLIPPGKVIKIGERKSNEPVADS